MTRRSFKSEFDAPEHSPGFLLWQVSMAWQRRIRAALKPLDLTHVQFVLLAATGWLTRRGAAITQVQIADHAQVDAMMTSQVLRTLEAKELVSRAPHPTDTRAKCVELTPAGRRLLVLALDTVEREDGAFFAACDDVRPELMVALRRLAGG